MQKVIVPRWVARSIAVFLFGTAIPLFWVGLRESAAAVERTAMGLWNAPPDRKGKAQS